MTTPGSILAGRYVLERVLGGGGMGCVWIARHTTLNRLVAVKLMTPEAHASGLLRARFEREAKACAQLRSPHVVQVFDYGVEDDVPYLVMELLEGDDLGALQRLRSTWPLAEVASLVAQAARGLSEAHELGIIHRDIKLSNLFVARLHGGAVLKILDFGIAKVFESNGPKMTGIDVQLGTPSYMSPEQVVGKPIDHRVDLWALAVAAFRLLTGKPCFPGESPLDVAQSIVAGQRRHVHDLVEGLPHAVEAFFARAFAADVAERFQSAAELSSALSRLSEENPGVSGRPHVEGSAGASGSPAPDREREPTAQSVHRFQPPAEASSTGRRLIPTQVPTQALSAVARPVVAAGLDSTTPVPQTPSPFAFTPWDGSSRAPHPTHEATPSVWQPGPSITPASGMSEPLTLRMGAPRKRSLAVALTALGVLGAVSLGLFVARAGMWRSHTQLSETGVSSRGEPGGAPRSGAVAVGGVEPGPAAGSAGPSASPGVTSGRAAVEQPAAPSAVASASSPSAPSALPVASAPPRGLRPHARATTPTLPGPRRDVLDTAQ